MPTHHDMPFGLSCVRRRNPNAAPTLPSHGKDVSETPAPKTTRASPALPLLESPGRGCAMSAWPSPPKRHSEFVCKLLSRHPTPARGSADGHDHPTPARGSADTDKQKITGGRVHSHMRPWPCGAQLHADCHMGSVTRRYTLFLVSHSTSACGSVTRRSCQTLLQMTNILPPTYTS